MFHSSSLCLLLLHSVFHFGGFCCYMFPSLSLPVCLVCCFVFKKKRKKSYSFLLQCVSQSVCLSLSMWPSSWLSGRRWKSGVTQWAASSGGFLRGEAVPLAPRRPNRRGLVLLSFSSRSFCLCVPLCHKCALFTLLQRCDL